MAPPSLPTPPDSNFRKVFPLLKTFLWPLLRWATGIWEAQTLPYLANKACEIYLGDTSTINRDRCRRLLQTRIELNPAQLRRFFHTSIGNTLLAWCGQFFRGVGDRHPSPLLTEVLLQLAADPEGLSVLSFLRHFPDTIQVNLDQLLFTAKRVELLMQETNAMMEAIAELAIAESTLNPAGDCIQWPDLRQSGLFSVKQWSLDLGWSLTDGLPEIRSHRPLLVHCYQPDPLPEGLIPVVIQSHGLASSPEDLQVYAEHLASHGYFVAAPQHPGSDVRQARDMLAGKTSEVFKLTEFIDRPRDISFLIDELERRNEPDFQGKLNLKSVGIMGYSFGAYTAFALAGADIHFEKLELACSPIANHPNLSLLLQCQALGLPRESYSFRDERIQAILSIDSVGSEVFGPEGIAAIQIPVFLMAGSDDAAAPLAFEQSRLFHWLAAPQYYLALMQGRSHIQDMQRLIQSLDLQIRGLPPTLAPQITPFEGYIKALSLVFFNQHLAPSMNSCIPLSASFATHLSQAPYNIWLMSHASRHAWMQRLQSLNLNLIAEMMDLVTEAGEP